MQPSTQMSAEFETVSLRFLGATKLTVNNNPGVVMNLKFFEILSRVTSFLQKLTITLMSDWTSEMVEFEKDMNKNDAIRTDTFTADQEWFLCSHVDTEPTKTENTPRSSKNDYPLYNISLHVKRKNGYYLWNIAMIIVRTYLVSP